MTTPKSLGQLLSIRQMTPTGRGAVATIRVEGDLSALTAELSKVFRSASGWSLSELPLNRLCFGQWGHNTIEDIVACRTSDSQLELHCHGGQSAVQRLLDDLNSQDFGSLSHAVISENAQTLLDIEFERILQLATTLRATGWILSQSGRMHSAAESLSELVMSEDWIAAERIIHKLQSWSEFGRHLTHPWTVVVAGRPNVGKSSLINSLVGFERSIVFDEPGTTRDVVTADTALDGWAVRLCDTAGQHAAAQGLEADGIQKARQLALTADLQVLVLDRSQPPHASDLQLLAECPNAIVVANKSDLESAWPDHWQPKALNVSSVLKTGLGQLAEAIVQKLIPQLPGNSDIIPLTQRQRDCLTLLLDGVRQRDLEAASLAIQRLKGE